MDAWCRLKEAFTEAVDLMGGVHSARPKAIWDALHHTYPMLTVQVSWLDGLMAKGVQPHTRNCGRGACVGLRWCTFPCRAVTLKSMLSMPPPAEHQV